MGRVYLARQIDLGRNVVVKVMHEHIAADKKFQERFQRETLLMARFQHPYVVTLYDASLNDPQGPCIVMEYIKGIPLDTLLHRNGRLSPQRIQRLLSQLCEALQAAHTEGIVHRDLKPANLMVVDPDTPYEKIKVMDFGLAKLVVNPSKAMNKLSDTGVDFAVGTPGYISPEQVRGDGMDHRSDLYSVGVILYELLTGRLPFTGSETMDVLLAHATDDPPSFAEMGLSGVIPPAIEEVVFCCMAKHPDDRPQSARELADMYENALFQEEMRGAPVRYETPSTTTSPPSQAEKNTHTSLSTPLNVNAASDALEKENPNAVIHYLQAWMPEAIATYKLRGFVDEVGGVVVESVPGKIRVRLGGSSGMTKLSGAFKWLGIAKKASSGIDLELHLQRNNPAQQSLLSITAIMKPTIEGASSHPSWREKCNLLFCELRAYLMGSGTISKNV